MAAQLGINNQPQHQHLAALEVTARSLDAIKLHFRQHELRIHQGYISAALARRIVCDPTDPLCRGEAVIITVDHVAPQEVARVIQQLFEFDQMWCLQADPERPWQGFVKVSFNQQQRGQYFWQQDVEPEPEAEIEPEAEPDTTDEYDDDLDWEEEDESVVEPGDPSEIWGTDAYKQRIIQEGKAAIQRMQACFEENDD